MNQDDLKRLITQYEQWQSTGVINFSDDDIIEALRELLILRDTVDEISDMCSSTVSHVNG